MSKYIVLYATLIGVDFCEEGDIIELPDGTDRNFIARMQTIGAIAPYDGKNDAATSKKDEKKDAKDDKKSSADKGKDTKKDDKKPPEDDKDANTKGLDENGNIND
ncbi:hypothetical protein [Campylobacter showae]|uniref:hypothetical protein n=1 Tax=Campylobacter showae TaxID=204 RepID=UPI0028D6178F|nr:hypothetical protein [Campylobacter showae]